MHYKSILPACVGILAAAPMAQAHTWIEQMMVLDPNGTMVGAPGYARGNVLRSSSGFSDPTMVNLIPPDGRAANDILPTDLMCKSSQTAQSQTDGSPRLQAAAGSGVALRYQENGHVTLPDNQPGKPPNRGTVFVYGTTKPSPDDSFLAIHRVWNADGTGGDGRGKLLSTQNFDDGQCYQVNGGTISAQRQAQFPHTADSLMGVNLWCQQDVAIPSDAPSGQPYTFYWVWDWPTAPGTSGAPNGKQEIYTTCMDVDIVTSDGQVAASGTNFATGQDLNSAGISSEVADITNPTAISGFSTIAFSASASGPVSGGAATASAVADSTATDTAVPGFLSVHTTSTGGPGLETSANVFTTVPTDFTASSVPAATTAQPAATSVPNQPQQSASLSQSASSDSSQGGHHGGNGFGGSATQSVSGNLSTTAVPTASGTAVGQPGAQSMATFTQFDTAYETVFSTIFQTHFTKRNVPLMTPGVEAIGTTPTATAMACSKTNPVYRLRARLPFYPFAVSSSGPEPTPC